MLLSMKKKKTRYYSHIWILYLLPITHSPSPLSKINTQLTQQFTNQRDSSLPSTLFTNHTVKTRSLITSSYLPILLTSSIITLNAFHSHKAPKTRVHVHPHLRSTLRDTYTIVARIYLHLHTQQAYPPHTNIRTYIYIRFSSLSLFCSREPASHGGYTRPI